MGYWGTGIFSGDQPCDLKADIASYLARRIETVSDYELIIPLVYIYADYLMHYEYRERDLKKFIGFLERIDCSKWKKPKERRRSINRLIRWIKTSFRLDGNGYNDNLQKVNLIGKAVYHLTLKKKIPQILKRGLITKKPNCGFLGNQKGIYVSDSLVKCLRWKLYVTNANPLQLMAFVKFIIKDSDEVYRDNRVDFLGDYLIKNNINRNRLIVFD